MDKLLIVLAQHEHEEKLVTQHKEIRVLSLPGVADGLSRDEPHVGGGRVQAAVTLLETGHQKCNLVPLDNLRDEK